MLEIWTKSDRDLPWVEALLHGHYGTTLPLTRRSVSETARLPGYIALYYDRRVGLVTYHFSERGCEIVTLVSTVMGRGVGSALLEEVLKTARVKSCERIWLNVTNDKLTSLRFFQKRGFSLVRVRRHAVVDLWPTIPGPPAKGEHGIPIRDEIELELLMDKSSPWYRGETSLTHISKL